MLREVPFGTKVEGKRDVQRIVSGVTASRALIDAAIAAQTRHLPDNATIWTGRGGRLYAVVMD